MRLVLGLLLMAGCAASAPAADTPDAEGDGPEVVLSQPSNEPDQQSSWQRLPQGVRGDQDRDKVPDRVDQCPSIPEDEDGIDDGDGCPDRDSRDPDEDADGIPNVTDKCPLEPEDRDGIEDADGCPEIR